MGDPSEAAGGRRFHHVGLILGTVILALTLGAASLALNTRDSWWSALLSNAAVTALLVIPAAWVGGPFATRLRDAERRASGAGEAAHRAGVEAKDAMELAQGAQADATAATEALWAVEVRTAADALEDRLIAEQHEVHQATLDTFARWREDAGRESTVAALMTALDSDLIATTGVRVSVWETTLHLRFRFEPTTDLLEISVEHDDGRRLGASLWAATTDAADTYRSVIQIVEDAGDSPGPGLVNPLKCVATLAEALEHAASIQAQKLMSGSENFHRITGYLGDIDWPKDGWYLTERGIFPRSHDYYLVGNDRLRERFWERHLTNKGWWEAPRALEVARAEHGITELHPPLPAPEPTIEVTGY